MLQLLRPMASIDLESTGVDVVESRIVEFGVTVLHSDGTRTQWSQRFNPGIPIPAEATAIHGITDADVAECPRFEDHARKIWLGLQGKDLVGYNLRRMDLPMLDESLRRCGLSLDLTGVRVIDAFGIFSKKEPRKLEDAVQKYCGRTHEGAHGAGADADATMDVLCGQLAMYEDLNALDIDKLAAFSQVSEVEYIDLAGKLYRKDGRAFWAFGKHRDKPVEETLDYAYWVLSKPFFPGSTHDALNAEIDRIRTAEENRCQQSN